MTLPRPTGPKRISRRALLLGGLVGGSVALTAGGLLTERLALFGDGWPAYWPPLKPTEVDTLQFFLRRRSESLTGSHLLAHAVDHAERRSFYLKGDAKRYEAHAWDDDAIYQVLDRDPERTYRLTPGLWLARRMATGDEVIVAGTSTIAWYDGACVARRSEPYSYTIKLEQRDRAYDAGGDLGRQDVIVVRYLPTGGLAERFYYSREWGWIGWEEYDRGHIRHRSWFNRIVSTELDPAVAAGCAPLLRRQPSAFSRQPSAVRFPVPPTAEG